MSYIPVVILAVYTAFALWLLSGLKKAIEKQPPPQKPVEETPFSIIIAARNEEKNLGKNLSYLVAQKYLPENYEIIVVADRCTDKTVEIVKEQKSKFKNLELIEVKEVQPGISPKKNALKKGIEKTKYSHLILMDADSFAGENYLATFNQHFSAGNEVVVNFNKFHIKKNFLHTYLLPERLLAWSVAASGVGHKRPFLCFGGSWGYTREIFRKVGGFDQIITSLSGDDDLLIYLMGKLNTPMSVCLNPKGWVLTELPDTLKTYIRQRRRHHSAGKFYSTGIKFGYAVFHLSNFLLWTFPFFFLTGIWTLALKFLTDIFVLKFAAGVFQEKINAKNFIFFEFGYLFQNLFIAPLGFIGKIKWK